ncbi:hypothetical protein BpHYR1_036873, partial [Brachionus plicatilis]
TRVALSNDIGLFCRTARADGSAVLAGLGRTGPSSQQAWMDGRCLDAAFLALRKTEFVIY